MLVRAAGRIAAISTRAVPGHAGQQVSDRIAGDEADRRHLELMRNVRARIARYTGLSKNVR